MADDRPLFKRYMYMAYSLFIFQIQRSAQIEVLNASILIHTPTNTYKQAYKHANTNGWGLGQHYLRL